MMTGKVTGNLDAVIEIEVVGSNRQGKIEVVIDTGFYGFLVLPITQVVFERSKFTHRCKTELFGLPCWGLSFWLGLG